MAPTLADGLRALEEAAAIAPTIGVELDGEYLRMIAEAEAMAADQSGVDKSWVGRVMDASAEHVRRAHLK